MTEAINYLICFLKGHDWLLREINTENEQSRYSDSEYDCQRCGNYKCEELF